MDLINGQNPSSKVAMCENESNDKFKLSTQLLDQVSSLGQMDQNCLGCSSKSNLFSSNPSPKSTFLGYKGPSDQLLIPTKPC